MEKYIVIKQDGSQSEPMPMVGIIELLSKGEISADSLVSVQGASSWQKVSDLLSLGAGGSAPAVPAAAPAAVSVPVWGVKVAFMSCMRRYACFSGRASRSEYWYFILAQIILLVLCTIVDMLLFVGVPFCLTLGQLAMLLPELAVTWRRMHDSNLHGAWALLMLDPFYIGSFILIFLCCRQSGGPNEHGTGPELPA